VQAFGIFEGGGAKGLAHVGALKAIDSRVEFIGVAGSSAGAVVAALVAAGYKADELFLAQSNPIGALEFDYRKRLFGVTSWEKWQYFLSDAAVTYKDVGALGAWWTTLWFYRRHASVINEIRRYNGVFSSDRLRAWVNGLLRTKLHHNGVIDARVRKVLFRHVELPLKIVATNVSQKKLQIFSRDLTPETPVAEAVAASISIPLFFRPQCINGDSLVDGGLLSNFPAWVFDIERRTYGPLVPTIGFQLATEPSQIDVNLPPSLNSLSALVSTVLSGDSQLEIREVENLHLIPIHVKVSTTAFDLSADHKKELYSAGFDAARNFLFGNYGPKDPKVMSGILGFAKEQFLELVGRSTTTHLRCNVVRRTTKGTLRVTYSFGMEEDPDDQLEFEAGGGACGTCWEEERIIVCDLEEARTTYSSAWKMNKYQQAMVPHGLKSLVCIPMYAQVGPPEVIGVLNFDSKEDLKAEFSNLSHWSKFGKIAIYVVEEMFSTEV